MPFRTHVRLGPDFARLWTASAISTVGDGITLAAGPLLVASLTGNPALVAGAAFAQQLPLLLVPLIGGAYADRLDRRRLLAGVSLGRCVAVAGLAAAVAARDAGIVLVYLVLFLLGTGEVLADATSSALLPSTVPPGRLAAANARLLATFTVGNQLLAKPLGGYLFAVAAALPFAADALTFLPAALLQAGIRPAAAPVPVPPPARRAGLRAEIGEGVRWLWDHRLQRTLAVAMGAGNVMFGAAFAVFVLYARQRLGVSGAGYGALLMASAAGGLAGTAAAGRLQARWGTPAVLRAGLVIETLTHVSLALAASPWAAAATLAAFGAHAMAWGVIVTSLLQRSVPDRVRGRVMSVYLLVQNGGAAVGSLLGGGIAGALGVTAPFWLAAAVMTAVTAAAWRPLRPAAAE